MEKLNVTLITVDGYDPEGSVKALTICKSYIEFGKQIIFTYKKPNNLTSYIDFVEIPKLDWVGYNRFILFDLNRYINTDYVMIIQIDGFIINPHLWTDEFFEYDYIGAPWNINSHIRNRPDVISEKVRKKENPNLVGNGGFSFRSKKLLEVSSSCPSPCNGAEDIYVCSNNEEWFVDKHNITYAPVELAKVFSQDPLYNLDSTFGFHGNKSHINKYNEQGKLNEYSI